MSEAVLKITTDAKSVQEAILPLFKEVLGADCDEETKRVALETISSVVKVENITISHCHIEGDKVVNMDDAETPKSGVGVQMD